VLSHRYYHDSRVQFSARDLVDCTGPWSKGNAVNHEAVQATFRSCTQWQESSYSTGDECVEVITELPGWVGVRDSQLGADSPVLAFTTAQ
jgi:hypothetical protein